MIKPDRLRDIIRFSLQAISRYSPEAEEILMMIAAHESTMGKNLAQIGGGPAKGLYGMETGDPRRTEEDIWENYLRYRLPFVQQITDICGVSGPDSLQVQYNHIYSTIMARLKLWVSPGKLPGAHDVDGMAQYCKDYYNSPGGAATTEKYMRDYLRLVLN